MSPPARELLAFCHIEKAAGTSLIHVLRRLFAVSYVDARPLTRSDSGFFGRADFELLRKLTPGLKCIGGHSVVPHSDIMLAEADFRFITLMREPVGRVVSHYRFWVERMGSKFGPDDFLNHPVASNFQVRKIAGVDSVSKAIDIIRRNFLLVGTIAEFDQFLVLFAGKLGVSTKKMIYRPRNIASDTHSVNLPAEFYARVKELNKLDSELYAWVSSELIPEYIKGHGSSFAADLQEFKQMLKMDRGIPENDRVGNMIRNMYFKPLTGLIRVFNGIPYSGSYKD